MNADARKGVNNMSEEKKEMPDNAKVHTGACKFCGQMGQVHTMIDWTQDAVNEEVTLLCQCDQAQAYVKAKERKNKAKQRIQEVFGEKAEKPVSEDVLELLLATVDAIEAKHIKGVSIDIGHGVKAKVSKMAKESIKVERSENKKTTYEE